MKLHWSPRSPFVRKVMIVAHERGLADRLTCMRTVAAMTTPHAELMKDNPLSKIPTLILDDGAALYDSAVICEYLDGLDGRPQLFPLDRAARLVALRRQALGDGFLDLLVLARNERLRAQPSDAYLASAAVRTSAVLASLDAEADALAGSDFSIGHIAIGCALAYLDFRFAEQDWRKHHAGLAAWHAGFNTRSSVRATLPVDDS
jgi:glutathione S-transferase